MSASATSEMSDPGTIETPAMKKAGEAAAPPAPLPPPPPPSPPPPPPVEERGEEEVEEVFEDASDTGEVFVRRHGLPHPPPHPEFYQPPPRPMVSTFPQLRPEDYDGTTDWSEYQIYYEQLSELNNWDEERKAAVLSVCLKGEARMVLAGLEPARRKSYHALTTALAQSFAPTEMVHLHQAELKARKRRPGETMANLGREIAKLVRLAYPTADQATREVIGINAFLEAIPGPASEMKLHVIKGRPRTLQEAVAHATEVDAVMEAECRKTSRKRGDVRVVGASDDDHQGEITRLREELEKTKEELREFKKKVVRGPPKEVVCYGCGKPGHYRRDCKAKVQGNGPRRLDQ